jgi:hypothetical protein
MQQQKMKDGESGFERVHLEWREENGIKFIVHNNFILTKNLKFQRRYVLSDLIIILGLNIFLVPLNVSNSLKDFHIPPLIIYNAHTKCITII